MRVEPNDEILEELTTPKKEAPPSAKTGLQADHLASVRLPRGHWDAFVIHCQKKNLSHKEALTMMIEQFVGEKYMEFAYSEVEDSRPHKN